MKLQELTSFLDNTLALDKFSRDASNNGLQVEGKSEVNFAVFGVDACQELFDAAAERGADFIFVHHGMSWGSEPRRFSGIVAKRLSTLFQNGISLYAAHLPLDAHPELGNNAQLADMIGLKERMPFFEYSGVDIGFSGVLKEAAPCHLLAEYLGKKLSVEPIIYGDVKREVKKIAIVSGGGGLGGLEDAYSRNCDLLITGEFDHTMYHPQKEMGVNVISLGHYASETVGPYAVMQKIQSVFNLPVEFINIPTGL